MKINSGKVLSLLRSTTDEQTVQIVSRALDDGAEVWVFQSVWEIETSSELTNPEKGIVRCAFESRGLGYAVWIRRPVRPYCGGHI